MTVTCVKCVCFVVAMVRGVVISLRLQRCYDLVSSAGRVISCIFLELRTVRAIVTVTCVRCVFFELAMVRGIA